MEKVLIRCEQIIYVQLFSVSRNEEYGINIALTSSVIQRYFRTFGGQKEAYQKIVSAINNNDIFVEV